MVASHHASQRAFVLRHTRLRPVPGIEETRLHLADEVLSLWRAVAVETEDPDPALPYWAFAWAAVWPSPDTWGEHPKAVAGRRVFDLASGSGLCAIAAMRAGAAQATGADIDAFAAAAIELNARANGCRVAIVRRDVLDGDPPDIDVILAGDCWYEARLAERVLPCCAGLGTADRHPRRRPRPPLPAHRRAGRAGFIRVRTTTELEDLELKAGRRLWVAAGSRGDAAWSSDLGDGRRLP